MITDASIKAGLRRAIELKDDGLRGEGRLTLFIRVSEAEASSEWYAVWWRRERRKTVKIGAYPRSISPRAALVSPAARSDACRLADVAARALAARDSERSE